MLKRAVFILLLMTSGLSHAEPIFETIDFNNLPLAFNTSPRVVGSSGQFIYDTAGPTNQVQYFSDAQFSLGPPYTGSSNVFIVDANWTNDRAARGSLERTDSGLFSVVSMDIINLIGSSSGPGYSVGTGWIDEPDPLIGLVQTNTAFTTTSNSWQTINLSGMSGLQNISMFLFVIFSDVNAGTNYAIDNIVISYETATSSVPEPTGLILLGLGLCGLLRQRKSITE